MQTRHPTHGLTPQLQQTPQAWQPGKTSRHSPQYPKLWREPTTPQETTNPLTFRPQPNLLTPQINVPGQETVRSHKGVPATKIRYPSMNPSSAMMNSGECPTVASAMAQNKLVVYTIQIKVSLSLTPPVTILELALDLAPSNPHPSITERNPSSDSPSIHPHKLSLLQWSHTTLYSQLSSFSSTTMSPSCLTMRLSMTLLFINSTERPTYTNLNRLIAQAISSLTTAI